MGLDVTYDCWSGSYGSFNVFRQEIAQVIGVPLELMENFYNEERIRGLLKEGVTPATFEYLEMYLFKWIPIKWESLKYDPLFILLDHSDCDGNIEVKDQLPIAERLEAIADLLSDGTDKIKWNMREKAKQFAFGLREANLNNDVVEFG